MIKNTIKNILLPEQINNYFLFPKRIIGFFLGKNNVQATQLSVSGQRKTVVEKYFEESSIDKVIKKADKYDAIKVALPGSLVIFKELTLPFTDTDKIRKVLDFEVESALPFSIDEAIVDFIVTKKSTVLACIARKRDIQNTIDQFKNVGVQVTNVGVDVIDIYGLYKSIYPKEDKNIIILNVEAAYTNVIYLEHGVLKMARTITKENTSSDFVSAVQFTLNSFRDLYPEAAEIAKVVIVGHEVQALHTYLENNLHTKIETFNVTKVLANQNITFKDHFSNSGIVSLAVAYQAPETEDFNLLRKEFDVVDNHVLTVQIISFFALFILFFGSLIGYTYIQTSRLQREVNSSKSEVITKLKNEFNITDPIILKSLHEVVTTANSKLSEEESIWFAFSQQTRLEFLKYLNELSRIIDKDAVNLRLKKLTIFTVAPDVITLQGEVKDFKALSILENQLNESNLFKHVSPPQETKFDIAITIKKNEELD